MRVFQLKSVKTIGVILFAALLTGGAVGLQKLAADREERSEEPENKPGLGVELVKGRPHTLFVPADVRTALGIRKDNIDNIVTAAVPTRTRDLPMPGTTMLDPTRLIPIRALFAPSPSSAQCVEIGTIEEDRLRDR